MGRWRLRLRHLMRSPGWDLVGRYAAGLVASSAVGVSMLLPQAGKFGLDWPSWIGVMGPMALLLMGALPHLPDRRLLRIGSFSLLSAAAFAGLVPLADSSLSVLEWVLLALLVAAGSGAVVILFFAFIQSVFAGRVPRSVVLAILVWASGVAAYTLYHLLRGYEGSVGIVGALVLVLVTLNGLAIQRWMGWGKMTLHDNALLARAGLVSIGLVGVGLLHSVVTLTVA